MHLKARWTIGFCALFLCTRTFAITITTEGGGAVSPDLTGKNLIAGRTYTLTAKARAGDFQVLLRAVDDANQPGVTATCQVHVIGLPP